MNGAWHLRHVMPKNPTLEQRIVWHIAHAKHCACRPIPPKLQAQIRQYTSARAKRRVAKKK